MHAKQFNIPAAYRVELEDTGARNTYSSDWHDPQDARDALLRLVRMAERESPQHISAILYTKEGISKHEDGEATWHMPGGTKNEGYYARIRVRAPHREALPQAVAELCHLFREEIRHWVSGENLSNIDAKNRVFALREDFGVCATHDYCDANQAMINAFTAVWGREPIACDDNDRHAIDCAWDAAKSIGFSDSGVE